MRIKLDDNWSVESDTSSWNLHYEKEGDINPKTGKPTKTSEVSYHARLVDAFKYYLNEEPKTALNIPQILERWDATSQLVAFACAELTRDSAIIQAHFTIDKLQATLDAIATADSLDKVRGLVEKSKH